MPLTESPPRIGLYGGAFDPPHAAHVALACAAVEQLRLDRLHITPTGDAWHRSFALSPAADRLAMCQLAFGALPKAQVDDRELRRDGPTYTIDTLTELRAQYPGAALFLLIGSDQAAAFHTWKRVSDIVKFAKISIAVRASSVGDTSGFDLKNPLPGLALDPARVRILQLPVMPHSATEVRRRAAARLPLAPLVPAAVAGYIAEHHLYHTPD
jgi:nicotinate-nucleotide adenylyltransferase